MSDEIDFLLSVCRPEIDGEDEVGGIDITVGDYKLQLNPVMNVAHIRKANQSCCMKGH